MCIGLLRGIPSCPFTKGVLAIPQVNHAAININTYPTSLKSVAVVDEPFRAIRSLAHNHSIPMKNSKIKVPPMPNNGGKCPKSCI